MVSLPLSLVVSAQIFIVFGQPSKFNFSNSSLYCKLIEDVAQYYNSRCIYLLTHFRKADEIYLDTLIKEISSKLSTNVYSFSDYQEHRATNRINRCYLPLHVVFSIDEKTRVAFQKHSHQSTMAGTLSSGGAVWLLLLESTENEYIRNYFTGINTPFNMDLLVTSLHLGNQVELKEIYQVRYDRPLRSPLLGSWTHDNGLKIPDQEAYFDRRSNLEGIKLKVTYIENNPFVFAVTTEDGRNEISGYMGDIWRVMEETLNFTSEYFPVEWYGRHELDGTWSGLVGSLKAEEFDAGVADLAISTSRIQVISYSAPLLTTQFRMYYKSMGTALEADALFSPLATDMWIALLCWVAVGSLGLFIGCYITNTYFGTAERYKIDEAIFFVAGALCAQGGVNIPQRYACRLLYILTFVVTAIVIPSYSASLMSFLAVLPMHIPFSNLDEFYENGNMRLTLKINSYEWDLFSESEGDSIMRKIYNRDLALIPISDFPRTNLGGVRRICTNGNLAFLATTDAMAYILVQEQSIGSKWLCSIVSLPKDVVKFDMGFGFQKNSPYRGIINYKLSALPERGVLKRLRKMHWTIAKPLHAEEYVPVGINNIFMVFVILGAGIMAALILFIHELISARGRAKAKPMKSMDFVIRRKIISGSVVLYYY